MLLSELTSEVIHSEIKAFYKRVSGHVAFVVKTVGNEAMSVPRIPRKMGVYQFDYFFAADLDQIFRFALGGMSASRAFILELCEAVEAVLFTNAWGVRTAPPTDYLASPLAFALSAARARCALRRENGPALVADEVRVLTGEPDDVLTAAGLLAAGGDAPAAVRDYCEQRQLPV